MEDIFDRIVAGEIPAYKVFENDNVLAFLDISQITKGHTLLIPKKHIENIYDYTEEDAKIVLSYLPVIARALKKGLSGVVGVNIFSNNEEPAGQSVFHSHFHLLPRYEGDGKLQDIIGDDNTDKYTPEQLESIAQKIRGAVDV